MPHHLLAIIIVSELSSLEKWVSTPEGSYFPGLWARLPKYDISHLSTTLIFVLQVLWTLFSQHVIWTPLSHVPLVSLLKASLLFDLLEIIQEITHFLCNSQPIGFLFYTPEVQRYLIRHSYSHEYREPEIFSFLVIWYVPLCATYVLYNRRTLCGTGRFLISSNLSLRSSTRINTSRGKAISDASS